MRSLIQAIVISRSVVVGTMFASSSTRLSVVECNNISVPPVHQQTRSTRNADVLELLIMTISLPNRSERSFVEKNASIDETQQMKKTDLDTKLRTMLQNCGYLSNQYNFKFTKLMKQYTYGFNRNTVIFINVTKVILLSVIHNVLLPCNLQSIMFFCFFYSHQVLYIRHVHEDKDKVGTQLLFLTHLHHKEGHSPFWGKKKQTSQVCNDISLSLLCNL